MCASQTRRLSFLSSCSRSQIDEKKNPKRKEVVMDEFPLDFVREKYVAQIEEKQTARREEALREARKRCVEVVEEKVKQGETIIHVHLDYILQHDEPSSKKLRQEVAARFGDTRVLCDVPGQDFLVRATSEDAADANIVIYLMNDPE